MITAFRFLYFGAAILSGVACALIVASLFIPNRAPQSTECLGVSLAVSAAFLGVGVLAFGIQRHVARIAAAACRHKDGTAPKLATHVKHLVAYLLAGGIFLCAAFGVMTYAILARIDQGFAVFG